ncbi:NAD-dependent epimerase/dehydratase family protein [Nocardioides sp. LMS-CY]|uniref:NAD-dependent epimerase/dehydratase family protein n=1 Tax=Nocardioides sp. (strain LMS-CY) TaxID=2840457 RepID=UPI001C006FF7|nr:NAD-dependent epimerase/dehydratase family protein [Nocardioides sp. LMS-CY]QWF20795.1 NAD-dependent epimerase/dehydratase family protein [Nocardioides sp. LMS-CY]
MHVFLTGSTGYIGSAVLTALLEAGHTVTALVRNEDAAASVGRRGATALIGDMRSHDIVGRAASRVDAVIATALPGDATAGQADADFVDAVLDGLSPGRTLIRTGGVWVHGSGAQITESSVIDPPDLVSWRADLDERALKARSVRSLLVEPGVVYGRGGGIPHLLASAAQTEEDGPALVLVGDGTQHWTTVHVDDLAGLYVLALTHGDAGSRFLGVSGENPTVRELGVAASHRRGLQGRVAPEAPADTVARLGAFGEALLLDQQASGELARRTLGWTPVQRSLVEELAAGGYDPR